MSNSIVDKASEFATQKHKGQEYNGGPFIVHPAQVASIIELLQPKDINLIAAAWLHDVLENTDVTLDQLTNVFNSDISGLVEEVTKSDYNTFPKLRTLRGVILKFADRIANLVNISSWDMDRQQRYLQKSQFWKTA